MPELPEVESVKRALNAALKGARIEGVELARADLRVPFPDDFAQALTGSAIHGVRRRAKYLLFELDSPRIVIAHLGMSGRFLVLETPRLPLGKHDHVAFYLRDGRQLIYNDARRFGLMTLAAASTLNEHPLLSALGPEPFADDFSPAYLQAALATRSMAVKPALMDQALVVGVGNIYASEALFLAKVHPARRAADVADQAPLLVDAIRQVLAAAIESGGSSLRDFVHITGQEGYFQHRFQVYGRTGKPCFSCRTPIEAMRQAGRSTFFCPRCQR